MGPKKTNCNSAVTELLQELDLPHYLISVYFITLQVYTVYIYITGVNGSFRQIKRLVNGL